VKILVVGGGNVGLHLAGMLREAGHAVTLIERDAVALARVRGRGQASIVAGDACDPEVLEAAGVRGADVVVAVTGRDEDNLVVANMAKFAFDAPQVVARIKNAENGWLYRPDMGVDVAVSAPDIIAHLIEERVTRIEPRPRTESA